MEEERGYPGRMDLRVVKTREAIEEAFLKSIKEYGFERCSVKTITQNAKINRSTFYKYYVDKYDLKDKFVDKIVAEFADNLDVGFLRENILGDACYFLELEACLERIYEHKEEYLICWNVQLPKRNVFQEMIDAGAARMRKQIEKEGVIAAEKKKYAGLYASLFLSTMMTSIRWWFGEGEGTDPGEFTWLMLEHMRRGITPTLKEAESYKSDRN